MAASQPNIGIPSEHEASFEAFTQSTQEKGLLDRPESLESRDLCDGLSDPPTLLYVMYTKSSLFLLVLTNPTRRFLVARRFDPGDALKQFQEACKFREEKHILRLYDLVDIADFEEARRIVSIS